MKVTLKVFGYFTSLSFIVLTEYWTLKNPEAPSRMGSETALISAVPSSHCNTTLLNHMLAIPPKAQDAKTNNKIHH
jgi:hypothetical protein